MASYNYNLNKDKTISNIRCEIESIQSSATSNASHLLFNYDNIEVGDICTFSERENNQDINTEEVFINKAKEKITAKNLTNEDIKNILLNTNFNINNHNENELDKKIEEINLAIKTLQEDQLEINAINIIKRVNDNNMLIKSGWSIKTFREKNAQNNESLSERVVRYCALPKGTKLNELPNRDKYIDEYFAGYFNALKKQGKSDNEIKNLLLTDFSKLVYNTSEEDRLMFTEAIICMSSENRNAGFNLAIESLNNENKNNFALTFYDNNLRTCITEEDYWGNYMSEDDSRELSLSVQRYFSDNELKYAIDNHDIAICQYATRENSERLENIRLQQEKNITLSEADEEFLREYNYYRIQDETLTMSASQREEYKDAMLEILGNSREKRLAMNGQYRSKIEREELEEFVEYAEEYAEELGIDETVFEKFMDEVTNGNYSIVKNDIANGTYTELNPPKAETESSGTSKIEETSLTQAEDVETSCEKAPVGGIGYNNTPEPPSVNPTEKLETIVKVEEKNNKTVSNPQQSQTPVTKAPTDIIDAVRTGSLKEYKKATRKTEQELTKELLNGDKTTIEIGKELFAKFNKITQELIFATLNNVACSAVLDLLSYKQLRKVEGNDHYMQTIIEEKIIEAEEKNKTGLEINV